MDRVTQQLEPGPHPERREERPHAEHHEDDGTGETEHDAQRVERQQRRPRRIEAAPLADANSWLENYRQLWERRYAALDELLVHMQAPPPKSRRKRH